MIICSMGAKNLIFLLSLSMLGACAHMDRSCLDVNWYELGRQDSALGLGLDASFSRRQKVCPVEEEAIQAKAYKNGFDAGLREYCRFKTGYIYGLSQLKEETRGCPEHLKQNFKQGYEAGLLMHHIQSLQNQIQEQIHRLESKLYHHGREVHLLSSKR